MGARCIDRTRRGWKSNCVVAGQCWEWKHGYGGDGYGIAAVAGGNPEHAHRLAYRLFKGVIKNDVLHTCDNKRCVRPKHLVDGTHSSNIKQAWRRSSGLQKERKIKAARMSTMRKKDSKGNTKWRRNLMTWLKWRWSVEGRKHYARRSKK